MVKQFHSMYIHKSTETDIQVKTGTQMFLVALFTVARRYKQWKCPSTDKRINKMWYTIQQNYYSKKGMDIIQRKEHMLQHEQTL